MNTEDLEELLKKNPHLDKNEILGLQKKTKHVRRKSARVGPLSPNFPFGGRRVPESEQDEWNQTMGYKPHYRGI